jgi:hypothetical protein
MIDTTDPQNYIFDYASEGGPDCPLLGPAPEYAEPQLSDLDQYIEAQIIEADSYGRALAKYEFGLNHQGFSDWICGVYPRFIPNAEIVQDLTAVF